MADIISKLGRSLTAVYTHPNVFISTTAPGGKRLVAMASVRGEMH